MRKHSLCCRPVSVRPSVRYVRVLYTLKAPDSALMLTICALQMFVLLLLLLLSRRLEIIDKLLSRHGSPITNFLTQSAMVPNSRGTNSVGAQNTRGRKYLRFSSTEITVYLGNGAR